MTSYFLIFLCFVVLAGLIQWRNKRVGEYRAQKMNSYQSMPVVHMPLTAMKAGKATTNSRLKALN